MMQLARLNNASDERQKDQAAKKKSQFIVSNGYNPDGTVKQAYLNPNEFNDVLNHIESLGNEDYNKMIRLYQQGKLSKYELEPLVNKYWKDVYDAGNDGAMVKRKIKKIGPTQGDVKIDKQTQDFLNQFKEEDKPKYSTGGAY